MKRFLIALLFFNIPFVYAESAQEYLSEGNDQLNAGYLDRAIIDYTRAIEMDPNLGKAFNNRGVAYAKEGSFPRAVDDFTLAIADNPKDAEAYNNRGLAYGSQGNYTQAVIDYTKAIKLDTFYVKAYNNRMLSFYQLKEYGKAWSDVHTVEAIGGKVDPDFLNDLKKASGTDQ